MLLRLQRVTVKHLKLNYGLNTRKNNVKIKMSYVTKTKTYAETKRI